MTNKKRKLDETEQGSTDDGAMESLKEGVVVPHDQVQKFLDTLKNYSDSCSESKKVVLDAAKKVEEKAVAMESSASRLGDEFKSGETILAAINDMRKYMQDEALEMRKKMIRLDSVVSAGEEHRRDCKTTLGIVDAKEEAVRSYSDFVQKNEASVKQQYTRSVYAASISRQIAMMSLHSMEATLRLLKTMHEMHCATHGESAVEQGDDGADETCKESSSSSAHGGRRDRCIDTVHVKKLGKDIESVINNVRNLKLDADDMERTVRVLDQVAIVNDAVALASSDVDTFYLHKDQEKRKRKQVENMVRRAMPFDRELYCTTMYYENRIIEEVSKRMRATGVNGSSMVTTVIDALKRDGVRGPGEEPKVFERSSSGGG